MAVEHNGHAIFFGHGVEGEIGHALIFANGQSCNEGHAICYTETQQAIEELISSGAYIEAGSTGTNSIYFVPNNLIYGKTVVASTGINYEILRDGFGGTKTNFLSTSWIDWFVRDTIDTVAIFGCNNASNFAYKGYDATGRVLFSGVFAQTGYSGYALLSAQTYVDRVRIFTFVSPDTMGEIFLGVKRSPALGYLESHSFVPTVIGRELITTHGTLAKDSRAKARVWNLKFINIDNDGRLWWEALLNDAHKSKAIGTGHYQTNYMAVILNDVANLMMLDWSISMDTNMQPLSELNLSLRGEPRTL